MENNTNENDDKINIEFNNSKLKYLESLDYKKLIKNDWKKENNLQNIDDNFIKYPEWINNINRYKVDDDNIRKNKKDEELTISEKTKIISLYKTATYSNYRAAYTRDSD